MSASRLVLDSPDLSRLVADGYSLRIQQGHLFIDDLPFVGADGKVHIDGCLVCPLDLQGGRTARPQWHVMWFIGGVPHDRSGQAIVGLVNTAVPLALTSGLTADCAFSQKPAGGYKDYYDKVTYYAAIITGHAQAIETNATALRHKPVVTDEGDSVFRYVDTFSSRAGIVARSERLALTKVVIIGLGGTGAYLLDFLAKVPITAIHLYDADVFATHNAFRAPGAASVEDLNAELPKVEYYAQMYDPMRRGLVPHPHYLTSANVSEILDADFVFIAMDASDDKKAIVDALVNARVPFIDTGIGVSNDASGIGGQIRITAGFPGASEHIENGGLISYVAGDDQAYESNVQVVELNALAAAMAVIRFKKELGFYADQERELNALYRVDTSEILTSYGISGHMADTTNVLTVCPDGGDRITTGEATA